MEIEKNVISFMVITIVPPCGYLCDWGCIPQLTVDQQLQVARIDNNGYVENE